MKFDAYAVLANIRAEGGGRAIRATCAIQAASNSTNSMNSTGQAAQAESLPSAPTPSSSRQEPPPGAITHLSHYRPVLDRDGRPRRMLPTRPATCAICGGSDWTVAMTDWQDRPLHVGCLKAEGGAVKTAEKSRKVLKSNKPASTTVTTVEQPRHSSTQHRDDDDDRRDARARSR